ncbi:hypothetical protein [Ancylobacter sp. IITR112]|uniref:hypothetical protein n=1 Tax=Ancylobacter sp. IITR112 TaxID=3138073 RepID=UPI00352B37F8
MTLTGSMASRHVPAAPPGTDAAHPAAVKIIAEAFCGRVSAPGIFIAVCIGA